MGLPPNEVVPVSAEARGKAREFIQRACVEDHRRLGLIKGFLRDIDQRRARHPGRRLRPDMLQDILRRWEAGPCEFRLRFEVEWKGRNFSVIEVAASGGTVTAAGWAADAAELNLIVNTAALKVGRQGIDFVKMGTICLSFHAIGRYFQRQPDRCGADLLRDLTLFSGVAISPDAPEQEVRYPSEGGVWVGQIAVCEIGHRAQTEERAAAFIRTWLPS
jgi:hypothetical protein